MKVDHIDYAVFSIDEAVERMRALDFYVAGSAFDDVKRNVRILFMCNGPYRVDYTELTILS